MCLKKDNKLVYLLSNYWFKKHEKVLDFNDSKINLKMKNKNIITSERDTRGMTLDHFRKEIKSLWQKINVEFVIKKSKHLCLLGTCQ